MVTLERRHSLPVILRELQNLVHSHATDTTSRTFAQLSRQPFVAQDSSSNDDDELLLLQPTGKSLTETAEGTVKWLPRIVEQGSAGEEAIFLPCDPAKDSSAVYVRSIIIARNFSQWKASFNSEIESEQLIPKGSRILLIVGVRNEMFYSIPSWLFRSQTPSEIQPPDSGEDVRTQATAAPGQSPKSTRKYRHVLENSPRATVLTNRIPILDR